MSSGSGGTPTCGARALLASRSGQSTVEAAVLLPSLMLVLALLLEPACLGYSLVVMRAAAAETARAVLTNQASDLDGCKAFARRRLTAVPNVPLFHLGGEEGWEVGVTGSGGRVEVELRGHARPLPLLGAVAALAGMSDGQGVALEVKASEELRPSWLGGGYESWQTIWG